MPYLAPIRQVLGKDGLGRSASLWTDSTSSGSDTRKSTALDEPVGDGGPGSNLLLNEIAPVINTLFQMLGFHVVRGGDGLLSDGLEQLRISSRNVIANILHTVGPLWADLLEYVRQP